MAELPPNHPSIEGTESQFDADELLDRLSADRFRAWYQDRQWQQNIENGQPYYNGPGAIPAPERHTPSQLLQCHRKMMYRKENAPAEQRDPEGIFWFGTEFEKRLLLPFLNQAVTGSETYVQNSIWVDYCVETEAGEVQIKGSTDPVIVDADAIPILPTEVKTKSSVENITEPNPHHRAQVHAYLVGLSEKFDRDISDAVLVYGGREALQLSVFHVQFDHEFWHDEVLDWAGTHTQLRITDEIPPAIPEYDWECRFCEYRVRCGKADTSHQDWGSSGFLPGYDNYPRETVVEYLEDNPEEALTPALARRYPDLIEQYGVMNWYCSSCKSVINWQDVNLDGQPVCPRCAERDKISHLSLAGTDR